jgi:uncharacterized repeat protein (TIGR03833 family)
MTIFFVILYFSGENMIIKRNLNMDGTRRSDIKSGIKVAIVLKKDQRSGNLTEGIVKNILTNSPTHPHGIKVRLESGDIGRVKEIYS